ncbi:hypothetical protein TNCV_3215941 [Trichonephila clavipes]|nr:hypothetical protein TNCV_3215941 [Trichonephila clavipes]
MRGVPVPRSDNTAIHLSIKMEVSLVRPQYVPSQCIIDHHSCEKPYCAGPIQYQKFLVIKKISTLRRMDFDNAAIDRSNTDSADRNPLRLEVIPDGITKPTVVCHRETDPWHQFHSRGNHVQQHRSHIVRFNGRQQFKQSNSGSLYKQNRHNFHSHRNEENIQRQGGQLIIDSMVCSKHFCTLIDTGSNVLLIP